MILGFKLPEIEIDDVGERVVEAVMSLLDGILVHYLNLSYCELVELVE